MALAQMLAPVKSSTQRMHTDETGWSEESAVQRLETTVKAKRPEEHGTRKAPSELTTGIAASQDSTLPSPPKSRGRQRSEESEDAILCATLQLLKKKPLRDVTVDEIARKAGVGKATIYKWWPNKAYVALDAFLRKMNRMVPTPDTGSAETDLNEQIQYLITFYTSPTGRVFGQFLAEAQNDPEFAALLRERFMKPRREIAGVMFDRAVKRGEIDPNLDRDLVLDLIYGPVLYRLLVVQSPFEHERVDALVSALFRGLRNRGSRAR